MTFRDMVAASDVAEGKPAVAHVGAIDIVVHKVGACLYATDRWCPHARGDLSDATLDGGRVTCPDHGWQFDLSTGACLNKDPGRLLRTYPCRVVDGRVEVDLDA